MKLIISISLAGEIPFRGYSLKLSVEQASFDSILVLECVGLMCEPLYLIQPPLAHKWTQKY